ncbi:universal stress protein [Terrimonas sp. NA20]|uniref:Universal stress protein n=1 Tax=Terrimonas ginsenosidimutans TaxID=2908004 RepID=A0ABS9KPF1_9BACT|nr:universal stress protein [Terrimonas ginsenosidimutans]MCG2614209.1 universal stress protein [Terrimonas ginsenosidimutans]
MPNKLYNILVPVDFTARNKWAIAKALELSNTFNCNVHLVYTNGSTKNSTSATRSQETILRKLEQLKSLYSQQICGEGKLEISLLNGNRQKELSNYIEQYEMDIVVVGLSKFNLLHRIASSISISRMAKKMQIPVLGVRSSGLVCHYKKIVLPVSGELPMRQIRLAALLGRAFKSTVYFVSLRKHAEEQKDNVVDMALEFVQSISTIPVQCFLLEGQNLAKSTLEFSKKINADLIVVNPVKDLRLPGLWNRMTNKLLSYGSKIPVMTVAAPSGKQHSK